jgi:hypothetical protein
LSDERYESREATLNKMLRSINIFNLVVRAFRAHGKQGSVPAHPRARIFKLLLAAALPVAGLGDIQTTTQTLSASISPFGKLSVPASISLRSSNTRFGGFAGTFDVSYWARTSASGGGAVTLQANSDFSPSGGPSIGAVTYTCSGATLGTGCSGAQALSTSTQTPLVSLPTGACTGGGGVCSTQDPNTVLLNLSAPSKPGYKTGNYSVQVIVTISTI